MNFATLPLTSHLGAEVRGIDFREELDGAALAHIKGALDQHSIVLVRGQQVTPQRQVAFARALGDLRVSVLDQYTVPEAPELQIVSNIVENGRAIGLTDAGSLWHTDGSYLPKPDMYTQLYALEVPHDDQVNPLGGTQFSSTAAAYEALPSDVKARIDGRRAIHSYTHFYAIKGSRHAVKRDELTAEQKAKLPDVSHPIVRTHPATGRKCLYVNEALTSRIDGMGEAESKGLLSYLFAHVIKPEFVYVHRWAADDLLIWDNCATQHLATFDYASSQRRKLHRAATIGSVPV
jgi:taurine dioxygenase